MARHIPRWEAASPGGPGGPSGRGVVTHAGADVEVRLTGLLVRIATDVPEAVQPVIDLLRASSITIRSVRPMRATLEDLFMQAVDEGESSAPPAR